MVHRSGFIIIRFITTLALCGSIPSAFAALAVNSPMDITQQVRVQPILVGNNDGSNRAEFFGTSAQQSVIEGFIDDIWAQAGIDVDFLSSTNFDSTEANNNLTMFPTIDAGEAAGVNHPDSSVINMYFVNRMEGSAPSETSASGVGVVGGNGIRQFIGTNLLDFRNGQEVIARVVAHEIGHNLGLGHNTIEQNLMQSGGNGERLNGSQITAALDSGLSVDVNATPAPPAPPVPVPAAAWLFGSALLGLVGVKRRRSA